jgi:hypothetical protein
MNYLGTDDQNANPAHLFLDDYLSLFPGDLWKVCKERSCVATACCAFFDRGGLTDAAWKQKDLIANNENKIANSLVVRAMLTKQTTQSLGRLEQAVTATLAYVGTWKDLSLLSLSQKIETLREIAGDPGDYDPDEDDWRPLVDQFDSHLFDIQEIWAPEMASPGAPHW